jgi:hypothetical protein
VGLLADDAHNTLWVTNSDPGAGDRSDAATQGRLAGVAAYDEITGIRRAYYDLGSLSPGSHFANDVTIDDGGNVYVTEQLLTNDLPHQRRWQAIDLCSKPSVRRGERLQPQWYRVAQGWISPRGKIQ